MKTDWYKIDDLEGFIKSARVLVFNTFGSDKNTTDSISTDIEKLSEEEQTELDDVLTQAEALLIAKQFIKEKSNKYTQDIEYFISEKRFLNMVEDLNSRMVSNLLHTLVKKGLLETAYDEEHDDFVFWSTQQPPLKNNEKDQKS